MVDGGAHNVDELNVPPDMPVKFLGINIISSRINEPVLNNKVLHEL